jgi:alpha-beta hydrolase superfamily lysophospholipase
MPYTEQFLNTSDGVALRVQHWPAPAAPKAVVIATHGHGEHCGKYHHVAQALNSGSYAAYLHDLRGHGKSGGPRGHAPRYEAFFDDLQLVSAQAQQTYPGMPVFLYGHSLGGQITLGFVLHRQTQVAGVIVSAPWLRLSYQPPAWKVTLARAMSSLWPTFTQSTGLDVAVPMTHDTEFWNSMPDVNLNHALMSARLGFAALAAGEDVLDHAGEFRLPILIMHGTADGAIAPSGSQTFYEGAASRDKTLRVYEGLYHEIHNEFERGTVLREMIAWLDQRVTSEK